MDRFTSFEGDTGPYILYTIVRIKSILAKYKESGAAIDENALQTPVNDSEKALMMEIAKYNAAWKQHMKSWLHIRSARIFMILPMRLTASIMRQRFWQKRMRRRKQVISAFLF